MRPSVPELDVLAPPVGRVARGAHACIGADATVSEALRRMRRYGLDSLLVLDGSRPAGIATVRQVATLPAEQRLRYVGLAPASPVLRADTPLSEAWQHFRDGGLEALPVRHDDGSLGLALSRDVLSMLLSTWEEESGQFLLLEEESTGERELRDSGSFSEERLRLVIEALPDGVVLCDGELRVELANQVFCGMVGRSRREVVGRLLREAFPADTWTERLDRAARGRGEARDGELVLTDPHGGVRHWALRGRRVVEPGCREPTYVVSFRDVTETRRLESVAGTKNLMENLGYVFSGIRHEIGNPLNTIITTANLMRMNLPNLTAEETREYVEWILGEARRIEYLLKSLKNFSLFDRLEPERLDLVAFLDAFVALVRRDLVRQGIEVRWEPPPGPPPVVWADHRALHHALLNLVTNAVHALQGRPDPRIEVRLRRREPRCVELDVEDNGRGIPPEQVPLLFKPFFSTREGGSGMGLALVRKILAEMGFDITVRSEPGRGACFTVVMCEGAA